ncbi:hypothetical protein P186_0885 [Pyrobaculum ferrireducens]|uniref:Uncharacterized protein n=1 Tax=Pyrobaculum ferrireducens TaxID=1104324 RepID=G7VB16_9CREN|nr:hypothetical protein P186_0885 [Pyrobaculum ferrireducens]
MGGRRLRDRGRLSEGGVYAVCEAGRLLCRHISKILNN